MNKKKVLKELKLVNSNSPIFLHENSKQCVSYKNNFWMNFKRRLEITKKTFGSSFIKLFSVSKIDKIFFEELEEKLLIADVGIETTKKIINRLVNYTNNNDYDSNKIFKIFLQNMISMLEPVEKPILISEKKLFVILIIGVNGVGKTTTIGKLISIFQMEGKKVMLAAGDTFRAAAIEQIQEWGKKRQVPVIAQNIGSDSASVIYDAIQSAIAHNFNILIADTAGRLHNKCHLMDELKKIKRVIKKIDIEFPNEIMLVIDATTGQNAVNQVSFFNKEIGVTGITITKFDGTAKGGIIFPIADRFSIPIRYIGIGENIEDFYTFKANDFVNAIFS